MYAGQADHKTWNLRVRKAPECILLGVYTRLMGIYSDEIGMKSVGSRKKVANLPMISGALLLRQPFESCFMMIWRGMTVDV